MNWTFLKDLLSTPSVSGNETSSQLIFEKYLEPHFHIKHDSIGNCYAILNNEHSVTVMLEAHIDQIGFQVTYIDSEGYIYVRANGGIDIAAAIGAHINIQVRNGHTINGVLGKRPIHTQKPEERRKLPEVEELWIDTGLLPEQVTNCITIGDFVAFNPNFLKLGEHRFTSCGLDNKVGIYVIAETLKCLNSENLSINVVAAGIVQEEIGCKGAKTAVANLKPQIAICVDVGFATDVPDMSKKKYGDIALGKGIVITYHTDSNHDMIMMAEQIAKENSIPFQRSAHHIPTGGTDTSSIQISGTGVKTLLLSIPNRYMHTTVEMCDVRDIDAAIDLLTCLVKQIDLKTKNKMNLYE